MRLTLALAGLAWSSMKSCGKLELGLGLGGLGQVRVRARVRANPTPNTPRLVIDEVVREVGGAEALGERELGAREEPAQGEG